MWKRDPPESEPVLTSDKGPIIHPRPPVTNPPFTHRGTLIPGSFSATDATVAGTILGTVGDVGKMVNLRFKIPEDPRRGAWIATPAAPMDLSENSITYLPPGKHHVEIRLILSEGDGFTISFDIDSSENPYALTIDRDSIKHA